MPTMCLVAAFLATDASEPNFRLKLQICLADFPRLYYQLTAVNLGDLLRLWVRYGVNGRPSGRFSGTVAHRMGPKCQCLALLSITPSSSRMNIKRRDSFSFILGTRRGLRLHLRCRGAPTSMYGNIDWYPFWWRRAQLRLWDRASFSRKISPTHGYCLIQANLRTKHANRRQATNFQPGSCGITAGAVAVLVIVVCLIKGERAHPSYVVAETPKPALSMLYNLLATVWCW